MPVSPIGNQTVTYDQITSPESDNDMFLKLLVAEMGAQNPLEPMDNQSFMEQLSQFSAMEKTSEMNNNLAELLQFQGVLAAMEGLEKGASLLGREVEWKNPDGSAGKGIVNAARQEGGDVLLDIGDTTISISAVTAVREATVPDKTNPVPDPDPSNTTPDQK